MGSKEKIVAIRDNREAEAQSKFSNYVQSIAFNMTLSRQMIAGLDMVRNYWVDAIPLPPMADTNYKSPRLLQYSHCVPMINALIRRGLVWHDYIPPSSAPRGHQFYKLTRAGELMHELLVEAGLLAPARDARAKKRA